MVLEAIHFYIHVVTLIRDRCLSIERVPGKYNPVTRASGCTLHLPFLRKTLSSSVIELRDVDSVVEGSQGRTAVHVQIRHLDIFFAIALCGIRTSFTFQE